MHRTYRQGVVLPQWMSLESVIGQNPSPAKHVSCLLPSYPDRKKAYRSGCPLKNTPYMSQISRSYQFAPLYNPTTEGIGVTSSAYVLTRIRD